MHSFNPCRVFWFVATHDLGRSGMPISQVSIPVGFSGSLQRSDDHQVPSGSMVSIPVGFSGSLQLDRIDRHRADLLHGFNPCRVFWFVATRCMAIHADLADTVSIPVGFSGSLQLSERNLSTSSTQWFQSLSGFLVRCNIAMRYRHPSQMIDVSIPVGFSGSLQRSAAADRHDHDPFQSLSGFLVRCNCRLIDAQLRAI